MQYISIQRRSRSPAKALWYQANPTELLVTLLERLARGSSPRSRSGKKHIFSASNRHKNCLIRKVSVPWSYLASPASNQGFLVWKFLVSNTTTTPSYNNWIKPFRTLVRRLDLPFCASQIRNQPEPDRHPCLGELPGASVSFSGCSSSDLCLLPHGPLVVMGPRMTRNS
jgi:hypothetical protein